MRCDAMRCDADGCQRTAERWRWRCAAGRCGVVAHPEYGVANQREVAALRLRTPRGGSHTQRTLAAHTRSAPAHGSTHAHRAKPAAGAYADARERGAQRSHPV
jgi:hypothetical protein